VIPFNISFIGIEIITKEITMKRLCIFSFVSLISISAIANTYTFIDRKTKDKIEIIADSCNEVMARQCLNYIKVSVVENGTKYNLIEKSDEVTLGQGIEQIQSSLCRGKCNSSAIYGPYEQTYNNLSDRRGLLLVPITLVADTVLLPYQGIKALGSVMPTSKKSRNYEESFLKDEKAKNPKISHQNFLNILDTVNCLQTTQEPNPRTYENYYYCAKY
jgi:hypothetical protein